MVIGLIMPKFSFPNRILQLFSPVKSLTFHLEVNSLYLMLLIKQLFYSEVIYTNSIFNIIALLSHKITQKKNWKYTNVVSD